VETPDLLAERMSLARAFIAAMRAETLMNNHLVRRSRAAVADSEDVLRKTAESASPPAKIAYDEWPPS
jgi:hypothetical protein